jgi:hypothetical protein
MQPAFLLLPLLSHAGQGASPSFWQLARADCQCANRIFSLWLRLLHPLCSCCCCYMQGEMLPLLSGGSQQLMTDSSGQFIVEGPTAARFKFSRGYENSKCIDSVTGVNINFPMIQVCEVG